jgi:hypothetical protein
MGVGEKKHSVRTVGSRANGEGQKVVKRLTFRESALADFEIMRFIASNIILVNEKRDYPISL